MKIVRIIGGLGNQMFQYALYIALKKKFPEEEILVDTSLFRGYNVHNGLELERVFGIELPQASFRQLLKLSWPIIGVYKISRFADKILPKRSSQLIESPDLKHKSEIFKSGDRYYIGYWQDYRYYQDCRNEILAAFKFDGPLSNGCQKILDKIQSIDNAVSIHIRRGDYLGHGLFSGICTIEYYSKAIEFIKSTVNVGKFYIFSDDIPWCEVNISPLLRNHEFEFVDINHGKDSHLDMFLMSKCRINIIANSSFSWWGAYLNTNPSKIVCAPKKWANVEKIITYRQLPDWQLF